MQKTNSLQGIVLYIRRVWEAIALDVMIEGLFATDLRRRVQFCKDGKEEDVLFLKGKLELNYCWGFSTKIRDEFMH